MTSTDLPDVLLSDLLAACPAAAHVFFERRMACVGCPFAPFETVGDAARAYGLDPVDLARSLAAVQGPQSPEGYDDDHH